MLLFCERNLKVSDIFFVMTLIKGKMTFTSISDVLIDVMWSDSWLKVPGA